MNGKYRVAWLTGTPCPLQRSFLEAVAQEPRVELHVYFCSRSTLGRPWDWSSYSGRFSHRVLPGVTVRIKRIPFYINPSVVLLCLRRRYDLFIVTSYAHPTMQLAMLTLSILGRKWALWAERPGLNAHSRIAIKLQSVALSLPKRYACCVIGTGRKAQEVLTQVLNSRRPSYSLPYLVDLKPFLVIPRREQQGRIRFLYTGQLIPRKGIDVLCSAMKNLLLHSFKAQLAIVGRGPEEWRVEKLQAEFPGEVHILGFVPFENRQEAYRQADVFVFPSRFDGWGVAVHEAMAAAMPVISTPLVGSACELVHEGENGFLVTPGSIDGLYQKMKFFIEHPDLIVSFGTRGRDVARRLTPDQGAKELLRILDETVGELLGNGISQG